MSEVDMLSVYRNRLYGKNVADKTVERYMSILTDFYSRYQTADKESLSSYFAECAREFDKTTVDRRMAALNGWVAFIYGRPDKGKEKQPDRLFIGEWEEIRHCVELIRGGKARIVEVTRSGKTYRYTKLWK